MVSLPEKTDKRKCSTLGKRWIFAGRTIAIKMKYTLLRYCYEDLYNYKNCYDDLK